MRGAEEECSVRRGRGSEGKSFEMGRAMRMRVALSMARLCAMLFTAYRGREGEGVGKLALGKSI